MAAAVAGLVSATASFARWGLILGTGRGGDDRHPLADLAIAVVGPVVAVLVQLAISRSREYGADATGARVIRGPEELARALERLPRARSASPSPTRSPDGAPLPREPLQRARDRAALLDAPPGGGAVARLRAVA